jgi:hypothetical protein
VILSRSQSDTTANRLTCMRFSRPKRVYELLSVLSTEARSSRRIWTSRIVNRRQYSNDSLGSACMSGTFTVGVTEEFLQWWIKLSERRRSAHLNFGPLTSLMLNKRLPNPTPIT